MSNSALGKSTSQIHNNLLNSLKYITNPEKTNGTLLVSGMGCSTNPNLAKDDFQNMADKFKKNKNKNINNVLAHHYLISFNPKDNLSAEKSHELSLKIMEKFLGKEYKALVATHNNTKDHIHTHIVFNSTGNTGKKYASTPKDLERFKEIINEVCKENNLTPIIDKKTKNKEKDSNITYKEWLDKNNICDKKIERFKYVEQLVKSIFKNNKIKSLEELEAQLKKYNIEVKYKNKYTNKLYENITFKSEEWERGFRGKFSISLENIINKIDDPDREENLTPYQEWSYKNYKESYKEFIKECIDKSVKEPTINNIEQLAIHLKNRYNIQMDYLSVHNKPLKRIKFLILDSNQKNKIGSASLDKENRNEYEYKGLQSRCNKVKELKFSNNLADNLKSIQRYLIANNKYDQWGLNEGIETVLRRNLKSKNDISTSILDIGKKIQLNNDKIKFLDETMKKIEDLYTDLLKYSKEYNNLENEIRNLKGLTSLFNKNKLEKEQKEYENKIIELKKNEYYSQEKKYSERIHEMTDEKYSLIEENRQEDRDIEILSQMEYVETHRKTICGLIIDDIEIKNNNEIEVDNDL